MKLTSEQKRNIREEIRLCKSVQKDIRELNDLVKRHPISTDTIGIVTFICGLWPMLNYYITKLDAKLKGKKLR